MEESKPLSLSTIDAWRKWLQRNHLKKDHVWLVHYKKNSGKAGFSHEDALDEALCYGWIDGKLKSIDNEKYILRYTPRRKNSKWSRKNRITAESLIRQGRMTEAGLAKIAEAKLNGMWENAYTLKGPVTLPDDLENALKKNKKAMENFNHFSPGGRNNYIYWVNSAKRKDTREKRIAEVVSRSEKNIKPGIQ